MNKVFKNISKLSVLALSLFLWSCDNIGQTVGPESDLSPRGQVVFSSTTGAKYVVIRDADNVGVVSGNIGSAGGQLHMGTHKLTIPRGAVSEPTVFSMSRSEDDYLRIRLSATRVTHNDVGAAGFDVPVQLSVDYTDADDLPEDLTTLEVIYFQADGIVAPQTTVVDIVDGKAIGELPHFSDYGLGWPTRDECDPLLELC